MKTKEKRNTRNQNVKETSKEKSFSQGYPVSPSGEDIYKKCYEEKEIDPEDIARMKESDTGTRTSEKKRKGIDNNDSTNELDVPGSELDDNQEDIGSEDEENNYYSLGGDKNTGLDEDHGEL
jgi:hypothetical protein